MRVLIYGFAGTVLGGIEMFVLNMNEHMSQDCVFDYIIERGDCDYRERIYNKGGRIFSIPWVRKHPCKYIMELWKVLECQKCEGTMIFYQHLYSMSNLIPALLAKCLGYRVVIHAHNSGLQNNNRLYVLFHKVGRVAARHLDFIRFTNSHLSSVFMYGKGIKSEIIFNAIDINKFSYNEAIRKNVREIIGADNKLVIGFVGRLTAPKNPLFLIRVFAEFINLYPETELWIVGEGEMKEEIVREIVSLKCEANVKWLGRRDDVNKLMQGMDLLLQPSLFEGLGIVLVEAQAGGLPVFSSKGVIPEEAVVTELVRLLPLSEPPSYWAQEILLFVDSCKDKNNRFDVTLPDYYNIDKEAKRLESLFIKMVYKSDHEK